MSESETLLTPDQDLSPLRLVMPSELEDRLPSHVFAALPSRGLTAVAVDDHLSDTQACCQAYGFRPEDSVNAIALSWIGQSGPGFAMALLPANRRLDANQGVRLALRARKVSFAPVDVVKSELGMEPGGVTPFGLPADWQLLIDPALLDRELLILGGAIRGIKLLVPAQALEALPNASIASICKPAPEHG